MIINNPHAVSQKLYDVVVKHRVVIDETIDPSKDYYFDFFAFKTL